MPTRTLAALAFAFLSAPALAASPADCRGIADSLLRLRCYDGQGAVPAGAVAADPGFGAYPARPYSGPVRLPAFSGPTRKYSSFRTRIREGMRDGPNFAGRLAMIQFGCGTGCSVVLAGDVATGAVHDFPLGGENAQALGLEYRRDSRLVTARWQDGDRCKAARYEWTGSGFARLSERDAGPARSCWEGR